MSDHKTDSEQLGSIRILRPLVVRVDGNPKVVQLVALIVFAIGAWMVAYSKLAPTAQPPKPAYSMGLRCEQKSAQIILSWNQNSAVVAGAQDAMLSIVDGDYHEDVPLEPAALRVGQIAYSPITSDVSFKLQVTSRSGTKTSESIRKRPTR